MKWPALFRKAPAGLMARSVSRGEVTPQGPYTNLFSGFLAREVNPFLYEAIREALGLVDGIINSMKMLDGVLRIETESDQLAATIQDWMDNVQINDLDHGLQAFYEMQGGEMYEQGCGIGEYVLAENGRDISHLRVADSKGIHFRREADGQLHVWYRPPGRQRGRGDGTDQLERVLRNRYQVETYGATGLTAAGYVEINRETLSYAAFHPEANNPYGTSIIRSNEFDARILLTMKNSIDQVWQRFGDPAYHLAYKTENPKVDTIELEKRKVRLATELESAINVKRSGNSADFVTAIGKQDDLKISIVGHENQVLEIEMPAKFILESVVGKSGLAPWMVGLVWGTSERLAQRQADAALHDSKVRFERRRPGLVRIIEAMLRARGVTWNKRDWQLVQELPSLQDLVSVAQAEFLQTQAQLMRSTAGQDVPEMETTAKVNRAGEIEFNFGLKSAPRPSRQKSAGGEPWAEQDPQLPKISARAEKGLLAIWDQFQKDTLELLGLGNLKSAEDVVFEFDARKFLPKLEKMEAAFVGLAGAEEGPLLFGMYAAWLRGLENAAAELDVDAIVEADRAARRKWINERGLELVTNTAARVIKGDIVDALASGEYDGLAPKDVARRLRDRFEMRDYDWQRLVNSEIAYMQVQGKQDMYLEDGIEQYDYVTAGDSLVSNVCLTLAAAGPYPVGAADSPLPMRDSHPNCRCTTHAHLE